VSQSRQWSGRFPVPLAAVADPAQKAGREATQMDQDRKREILAAEAAFAKKDQLAKALAEGGVYVLGKLTGPGSDIEIDRRPLQITEPEVAPQREGE
jgi:hypothetical protein